MTEDVGLIGGSPAFRAAIDDDAERLWSTICNVNGKGMKAQGFYLRSPRPRTYLPEPPPPRRRRTTKQAGG